MSLFAIAAPVLGMALGGVQAAPAPSPLFGAFKAACYDTREFAGVAPAAKAAGWTEVPEAQADRRIATIVAKGRDAMKAEEPGASVTGQVFRKRIDGRDVWLVTSRVQSTEGWWANGCRAYDLDMPAAPPRQTLDGWVGKPPTTAAASGNATKRLWEPWKPGVTLEITYVPRDNPLGATYGIQGLVLVAKAIGGF
ncbi:hypothetical protein [Sphingomonas sp.]|uniref:hypothetical protein n=1 Tax=Sphingomonas sp. TaxID=28214 RepID=UPI001ED31FE0|nr:hypothetical protein [Sphingomonas sp.]MBX3593242.1 hypothetical protein [Sphingomonas sp.]